MRLKRIYVANGLNHEPIAIKKIKSERYMCIIPEKGTYESILGL